MLYLVAGGSRNMAQNPFIAATATLLLSGCLTTGRETASTTRSCDRSAEANRQVVLSFYNAGLVGLQPRSAFERYMAPDFVEHKPDVPNGTRDAAATYLEQVIASVPQPRWEIIRTIAEGDMVFLHGRFTSSAGAPAYALADVFRLKDCKIVEHWDVVAAAPKEQRNPNSRF
jgi:predicted SnoaL-like aldol condensation-catalyzing enzyme